MHVAVVGGTGTLGSAVIAALADRDHEVASLSRSAPKASYANARHHRVDLRDGSGLDEALAGVEAVVDAANGPPSGKAAAVLVEGSRRLMEAERRAGVAHHVAISIVGCERVPTRYYRVKARQEEVVRAGPVGWTIVRATQFHDLVAFAFRSAARYGVLPAPRKVLLQPVDVAGVARLVADAVVEAPARDRIEIVGPQIRSVSDLAGAWKAARGSRAVRVAMPLPGRVGRALRDGALTDPAAPHRGATTFEEWLAGERA